MSAGTSKFQKQPPTKLSPTARPQGGANSVPQSVESKGRRAKLIAKNTDKSAVKDVHELT